jgi:predicted PurR-regulated permease PerM
MRRPKSCCREKCRRTCLCPQIQKSYSLVVYSSLLVAAYVTSDIVLPFVFAIVLKLLLQPALRILEGLYIPRTIASLLLILALFGTIVGLGTVISGPARTWAAKLPEGIPRLQERLSFVREPIDMTCPRIFGPSIS